MDHDPAAGDRGTCRSADYKRLPVVYTAIMGSREGEK